MEIQISDLIQKAWVPFFISDFGLFFIDPLIHTIYTCHTPEFLYPRLFLGPLHKCKHDSRTLSPLSVNTFITLWISHLIEGSAVDCISQTRHVRTGSGRVSFSPLRLCEREIFPDPLIIDRTFCGRR